MTLFYNPFSFIAVIFNLGFKNELFLTLPPLVLSVFVFENVSKDEIKIKISFFLDQFIYCIFFVFKAKDIWLLFLASFDTFLRTKTLRTSGRRAVFFIICMMVGDFLHAARWPLAIIPNTQKNILLLSKKKYLVRSYKSLKKIVVRDNMHSIFSHFLSLPQLYVDEQELQNLFLDTRKQSSIKVRVLLEKAENNAIAEWKFLSPTGFIIQIEYTHGAIKKNGKSTNAYDKNKARCFIGE